MNETKDRVTQLLSDFMKEYEGLDILEQKLNERGIELQKKEDDLKGRENTLQQERVLIDKEKQLNREHKEMLDRRETALTEKLQKVNNILSEGTV
jgi:Skp family chaperone for outer membrane proteins